MSSKNVPATTDGATTAVAIPQEGGLSGGFDNTDIVLPVCSLVQPMSQNKGESGKFWFPDGRAFEGLSVVVLEIIGTRSLWAPIDSGEGLLCKSADRVMGLAKRPDIVLSEPDAGQDSVYIECQRCPHFEDEVKWVKGGCRFGYTLLCWEAEQEFPFLYFVKGTHVKPIKQKIVSPALQRLRQGHPPAPWRTVYAWKPQLVEQPGKKFWVPDIMPARDFDEGGGEIQHYAEMSAELRSRASQQAMDEEMATFPDEGGALAEVRLKV